MKGWTLPRNCQIYMTIRVLKPFAPMYANQEERYLIQHMLVLVLPLGFHVQDDLSQLPVRIG